MPNLLLAVLDKSLVDRFCNGTASEHHDAEQELQSRLRAIAKEQEGASFTIQAPIAANVHLPAAEVELSAKAAQAIAELQAEAKGAPAKIVRVDFWPGEFRLLVLVDSFVYHVNSSGEARKLLR